MATGFRVQIRRGGGRSASKETEREKYETTPTCGGAWCSLEGWNILSLSQDPGAMLSFEGDESH